MDLRQTLEALDSLVELERAYEATQSEGRRPYVRAEHVPFLESRLRTFDEYMAVCNSEFHALCPSEASGVWQARKMSGQLSTPPRISFVEHMRPTEAIYIFEVCGTRLLIRRSCRRSPLGKSTVSQTVYEVADAIKNVLFADAFPPFTREDLEEVAVKTQQRYDYPRAVGFMDGKHISIKQPAQSGILYFNYKRSYSIILLALVDFDSIPHSGLRLGGTRAGLGCRSVHELQFKAFFDRRDDIFPPTRELGTVGPVQYHILVDCGFGQGYRYVRPYSQATANTASKKRFNAKHSGARRMVESTFGILCQRFAILQNTMQMEPENARRVVTAMLVLHNVLTRRQDVLEEVERFPAPARQLDALQEIDMGSSSEAGARARELIRVHYDNTYGPLADNQELLP